MKDIKNLIESKVNTYKVKELIFLKDLNDKSYPKSIFYNTIYSLCAKGKLVRLDKGIYCRPEVTKYGLLGPSEKEIISYFTDNNRGVVIGYRLFNKLNITTQVSNDIEILSNNIKTKKLKIKNIYIYKVDVNFTNDMKKVFECLEVMKHCLSIQELSEQNLFKYFKSIFKNVKYYNEVVYQLEHRYKRNKLLLQVYFFILDMLQRDNRRIKCYEHAFM